MTTIIIRLQLLNMWHDSDSPAHLVLARRGGPGFPVPPSRGLVSSTLISYSVSGSRCPILCVGLSTGVVSINMPDIVRYSTWRRNDHTDDTYPEPSSLDDSLHVVWCTSEHSPLCSESVDHRTSLQTADLFTITWSNVTDLWNHGALKPSWSWQPS